MEFPVDVLRDLSISNLIAMAAMLWFMYSRIDKRFEKVDQRFEKVDQRFEKMDQRLDKMDEKLTDIDRRLCRMEGAFASKDCCMIKDERQMKKAE